MPNEVENIVVRYARRSRCSGDAYSPLTPAGCMVRQEKERVLLRWILEYQVAPVSSKRLLEIGCGSGANLLEFLRLGFRPENMVGNDLLPERARAARDILPHTLQILDGSALEMHIPEASFHVVFQSTVFTSILDTEFQETLARRMWSWVMPGGGVLWYDFVYDNPRNPDVKGVALDRIRRLFPHGRMRYWRVTLAPPINRTVTRVHPFLYTLFNTVPFLRTHVLCWIQKD
jgi:SAM-dependent methyltransferase